MRRSKKPYRLKRDPRTRNFIVDFRLEGRRHSLSTRTTDPREAARGADAVYERFIAHHEERQRRGIVSAVQPLDVLVAEWLADFETEHTDHTSKQYRCTSRRASSLSKANEVAPEVRRPCGGRARRGARNSGDGCVLREGRGGSVQSGEG